MTNRIWAALGIAAIIAACATSPTGRNQLKLFANAEVSAMGVAAYDELKKKQKVVKKSTKVSYVTCIADAITATLSPQYAGGWEVNVFEDDTANAFALPGKKIGVHTGMLKVAVNQDQLAAVIGHEIGHVIAEHGNERMSMQFAAQTSQQLVGLLVGGSPEQQQMIMGALGLGAQYGVLLPYGRIQESEADQLGIIYMAQAGFNPAESVTLWRNMGAQSKGEQPPEFMSTHPSHQTRIKELQQQQQSANSLYEIAKTQGKRPNCRL